MPEVEIVDDDKADVEFILACCLVLILGTLPGGSGNSFP